MKKKQEIVLSYFYEGLTKKEIVLKSGLSWHTVDKYVRDYSAKLSCVNEEIQAEKRTEIIEDIVKAPQYDASNRKKRKVTEELLNEVRFCIDKNTEHRNSGRKKQQMKKIDMFNYVKQKGYEIGYTSLCSLVNEIEQKSGEAFIKQRYVPGNTCEFDWGEVKLIVAGKPKKYYLAVFTAAYSNYRYALLFERENTQSFWTAHARFFEYIGGNYRQMVYDNMRVAVKRFVGRSEKEATDGLLKLSMYYLFDYRFCNTAKGNEKGHVERSVEYIRRKAFSSRVEFANIAEANSYLVQSVESLNSQKLSTEPEKSANDMFLEEITNLGEAKPLFECGEIMSCRADKYSTVSIFQNHYSVPENYVGKMIDIKLYADKIVLYDGQLKLCEHVRSYELQTWNLKLEHYLKTLEKKPGALRNSVAIEQAEAELQNFYKEWFKNNEKDFITLLFYMKKEAIPLKKIIETVDEIVNKGCRTISTDAIKTVIANETRSNDVTAQHSGTIESKALSQLAQYNNLFVLEKEHEC